MDTTGRTLVIGDIHGALKALIQIIERAEVTENDLLIFLGDYVDGWSQSPEVINYLIQLKQSHNCIFMRGNHDDLCYRWLKYGEINDTWLLHGGQATVDAYSDIPYNFRNIHIHFLESLQNYHLDDKNRLFVHAGFTNHNGVKHEYFERMFYWDRSLWELALAMDKDLKKGDVFYPKRLSHYEEIFIGHTSLSRIGKDIPINAVNVWNVDTGAAHRNSLTIMDVDTKMYWQSDPVYSLYPNEKGRN